MNSINGALQKIIKMKKIHYHWLINNILIIILMWMSELTAINN